MSSIHVHLASADDPTFVLLRTSSNPNPERKPPMRIRRDELDEVLLMLLDAATAASCEEAIAC